MSVARWKDRRGSSFQATAAWHATRWRKDDSALPQVSHAEGHVAGSDMPLRGLDVTALIVEIDVGLESRKERAFVQPSQEHCLVHTDIPVHQRAHGALVRRGA